MNDKETEDWTEALWEDAEDFKMASAGWMKKLLLSAYFRLCHRLYRRSEEL